MSNDTVAETSINTTSRQFSILGVPFGQPVPADAASYDAASRQLGATIEDAITQSVMHGYNGVIRKAVFAAASTAKGQKITKESELVTVATKDEITAWVLEAQNATSYLTWLGTGTSRADVAQSYVDAAGDKLTLWRTDPNELELSKTKLAAVGLQFELSADMDQIELAKILRDVAKEVAKRSGL